MNGIIHPKPKTFSPEEREKVQKFLDKMGIQEAPINQPTRILVNLRKKREELMGNEDEEKEK